MQLILSGKAHPRDNPGKDLIRQIVHMARQPEFRRSIVFVEDYEMNVARYLVQGVDVWLNTPLRPMEASGTSGMKVAANGGLNVSVLDGWWAEGYEPNVGWAIGSGESYEDLDYQNSVESQALYNLLEKEVVPIFYERTADDLPRGWIARMKTAMRKLAPEFNTNRMVRDYSEQFYAAALKRWQELTGDELGLARELADWKRRMRDRFSQVRVEGVQDNMNGVSQVGGRIRVEAQVILGEISPDDVVVQLYYGQVDADGQLLAGEAMEMSRDGEPDEQGRMRYVVDMPCERTGLAGYTVRVLPRHKALGDPRDMGLVRWA
jgi:starch phosphorylase